VNSPALNAFTPETPLLFVLNHPDGRRVIERNLPDLLISPELHTMFEHPVRLVLRVFEAARDREELQERIFSELADVRMDAGAPPIGSSARITPRPDYEADDTGEGSARVTAPRSAEQWSRFEIVIDGPAHGNPFVDVELRASFESDGQSASVPGFYDGDGVYRIRFMPPTAGTWTWVTASNARSLHGLSGEVTVAASTRKGPVRVAETFHFAYADGTPYRPVGTTLYAWTHQGSELEEQTLETLAEGWFNKARMCIFPKFYAYNEKVPERYPFVGSDEEGFDFERFNPEFFRYQERRIEQLGELGIQADLILFHGYDRWGFSSMGEAADDRYLAYVVARLGSYDNVWWSLANEFDLMPSKTVDDWERFARVVAQNDPSGHLLSIHNSGPFYDWSQPWVTHASIQRQEINSAEHTKQWRETWNKPIVLDECAYEGNIDHVWGCITGQELVRRFWEATVRGGYASHGETLLNEADTLWWSHGGKLYGQSQERLKFLHDVLSDAPALNPLPSLDWDVPRGGVEGEYYLTYLGIFRPKYRVFVLDPARRYSVDIIDTWNMTVTPVPGEFEGRFQIDLPGEQYLAVRARAIG
jgi:hypothetical protein